MLTKLTLLASGFFSGNSNITDESKSTGGLRGIFNAAATQVNELIDTLTDGLKAVECGSLYVGIAATAYPGYLASNAWFVVDGVNPPTIGALSFIDTVLGTRRTMTVANGVVTIV